jgi:hypothetical protein
MANAPLDYEQQSLALQIADLQHSVAAHYAKELHAQRVENRRLNAIIDSFGSTATELQDRITFLEIRLQEKQRNNAI